MPKVEVRCPHRMPADEARHCVERLSKDLREKFALQHRWVSHTECQVERTGISGAIKIEPDQVVAFLDLSFALSPMKGKIEARIKDEFNRLFSSRVM